MTPRLALPAALVAVLSLSSCANPPPECAATAAAYRVCSDEQVWECPVATPAQLSAKQVIEDGCKQAPDQVKCLLDAKFELYPMTLVARCAEAGQVCVEGMGVGAKTASCQMK